MKAEKHKLGVIAAQVECKTGWWNTLFQSAPFVNPQWYSLAHTCSKCSVSKELRINKRVLLEVMIDEAGGFLLFSANEWNEVYTRPWGRNETLIVWFLQEDKDMKSLSQVEAFCGLACWIDTSITFTRYQLALPTEKHFWTTQGHRKTCAVNDASEPAEEYITI